MKEFEHGYYIYRSSNGNVVIKSYGETRIFFEYHFRGIVVYSDSNYYKIGHDSEWSLCENTRKLPKKLYEKYGLK